jgi:hypothetical protein
MTGRLLQNDDKFGASLNNLLPALNFFEIICAKTQGHSCHPFSSVCAAANSGSGSVTITKGNF